METSAMARQFGVNLGNYVPPREAHATPAVTDPNADNQDATDTVEAEVTPPENDPIKMEVDQSAGGEIDTHVDMEVEGITGTLQSQSIDDTTAKDEPSEPKVESESPNEEAASDGAQTVTHTPNIGEEPDNVNTILSPTVSPGVTETPVGSDEVPTNATMVAEREETEEIPVPRLAEESGNIVDVRSVGTGEQSQVFITSATPMVNDICGGSCYEMVNNQMRRRVCGGTVRSTCSECYVALCDQHATESKTSPGSIICESCDGRYVASQQFSNASDRGVDGDDMNTVMDTLTAPCSECTHKKRIRFICLHGNATDTPPTVFCEDCIASKRHCPVCVPSSASSTRTESLDGRRFQI
jgi:hypothetical protein